MNFFCQISSQTKGHDVKLQKQQKLLSMFSLKLAKILDNLMVIKESENLDSVRMTSMKRHATEDLAILSHANGSITQSRRDDTTSYLSCDYKQLRSGVQKSSEFKLSLSSKTIKTNLLSNATHIAVTTKDPFLRLTTSQAISQAR